MTINSIYAPKISQRRKMAEHFITSRMYKIKSIMAEDIGFEPMLVLPRPQFSKLAQYQALSTFRKSYLILTSVEAVPIGDEPGVAASLR